MNQSWPLQQAVYEELGGDAGGVLTGALYDEVPEGATDTLYTVLGETTEVPDDTHDADGSDETLTTHTWHRDPLEAGAKVVKQEMAVISAQLHHATLDLPGGGSVHLTRAFAEVLREEDPDTGEVWRHGVMRFRARTLETS